MIDLLPLHYQVKQGNMFLLLVMLGHVLTWTQLQHDSTIPHIATS